MQRLTKYSYTKTPKAEVFKPRNKRCEKETFFHPTTASGCILHISEGFAATRDRLESRILSKSSDFSSECFPPHSAKSDRNALCQQSIILELRKHFSEEMKLLKSTYIRYMDHREFSPVQKVHIILVFFQNKAI